MSSVIQVENLWKKYRLGVLGTGTLRHDFNRWWHRVRGLPDPYAKVGGETNRLKDQETNRPSLSPLVSSPVVSPSSTIPAKQTDQSQLSAFPISALSDDEVCALRGVSFEVKKGEM